MNRDKRPAPRSRVTLPKSPWREGAIRAIRAGDAAVSAWVISVVHRYCQGMPLRGQTGDCAGQGADRFGGTTEAAITQADAIKAKLIAFAAQLKWVCGSMRMVGACTRMPNTTNIAVSSLAAVRARMPERIATPAAKCPAAVA